MKKMTLKEAKANLEKDYVDCLAAFATYINSFPENEQYEALEELDDRIFETANWKWGYGDEWLHVYSGLRMAVEEDDWDDDDWDDEE